jgi:hypothetical protein
MYRCNTLTGYSDLRAHIQRLESENAELKARLRGIGERAEYMQVALIEMEEVLHKLVPGG